MLQSRRKFVDTTNNKDNLQAKRPSITNTDVNKKRRFIKIHGVCPPPPHHHHPHSNSFVHPRPRPTLKAIYSIVSYCILLHRIVKQVRCPHAHIGHWLTGWEPIQKSTPINLQDHSLYLFSSIVTRLPNTGNDDSVFHEKIYYTCSFLNQFGM